GARCVDGDGAVAIRDGSRVRACTAIGRVARHARAVRPCNGRCGWIRTDRLYVAAEDAYLDDGDTGVTRGLSGPRDRHRRRMAVAARPVRERKLQQSLPRPLSPGASVARHADLDGGRLHATAAGSCAGLEAI